MFEKEFIFVDMIFNNKHDVLKFISEKAVELNISTNANGLLNELIERENELSTDLGLGISLPHAKSEYVSKVAVLFINYKNDIQWGNDSKISASIVFLTPKSNQDNIHLKMLSQVSRSLMHKEILDTLLSSKSKDIIYDTLKSGLDVVK